MNQNEKEKRQEEAPILRGDYKEVITWQVRIPQCCIEGWPDCPHVVQKLKAKKKNIGL